jgi:hypothetical protein
MKATWTERADKVLDLLEDLPAITQQSAEKEFRNAVWSLCQQLKESEASSDGGQFLAPPLF